ncbi:hypothetical protein EBB07_22250 [Paenibacillaceae bacterium]|nr:hypothetical protein EBB07_22250 [Paenibacillaceae bacterium]
MALRIFKQHLLQPVAASNIKPAGRFIEERNGAWLLRAKVRATFLRFPCDMRSYRLFTGTRNSSARRIKSRCSHKAYYGEIMSAICAKVNGSQPSKYLVDSFSATQ